MPPLRPEVSSHSVHADARRPSVTLTLEQATEQPKGYRAAWGFLHQERKEEMALLSSSLGELKELHEAILQDHKDGVRYLAAILEEVQLLREIVQASGILTVGHLPWYKTAD